MLQQERFERLVAKEKQDPSVELTAQRVRAKYGPMFTPNGVAALDPEMFKAFLTYDENQHWSSIHRWGGKLTADLPKLRAALLILLDESKPISARIDEARRTIDGLGKAVISAILQIAHPEKYGIYNSASDDALEEIGTHPRATTHAFESLSTGRRYDSINQVLVALSLEYGISLWSLDRVLGAIGHQEDSVAPETTEASAEPVQVNQALAGELPPNRFGMERHLEDFLVDNWEQTPLASALEILVDKDGDSVGEQYQTTVGLIDILCRNKDGSGYTVVELKRDQTPDGTIGQIARYMGWVKKNLVKEGQSVRGLIISRDADDKLMTALTIVPNIEVFTYVVSFSLSKKGTE